MAFVGLYLRSLPAEIWQEFVTWIFKKYPNVNMIYVHHTTTPQPFPSTLHCHINLPQTIEEFNTSLSSRVRYNTKWYPKKIKEAFGDYEIKCWQRNEMPQQAYDLFKKWKKEAFDYTGVKVIPISICLMGLIRKPGTAICSDLKFKRLAIKFILGICCPFSKKQSFISTINGD